MTSRELWEKLNRLYGETEYNPDLQQMKNGYHAKVTMYFLDNPDQKVTISKSHYHRLHDGGIHTWCPWDYIESVMVEKKMTRYIKWVD